MRDILKKLKSYRDQHRKMVNQMVRPRKDNSPNAYVIKYLDGITDGLSKAIEIIEEKLKTS